MEQMCALDACRCLEGVAGEITVLPNVETFALRLCLRTLVRARLQIENPHETVRCAYQIVKTTLTARFDQCVAVLDQCITYVARPFAIGFGCRATAGASRRLLIKNLCTHLCACQTYHLLERSELHWRSTVFDI